MDAKSQPIPGFERLREEILWLHARWRVYRQLFGANQERIDLLARVAGSAFRIIQDSLVESLVVGITRVTESAQSGSKNAPQSNLTMDWLVTSLKEAERQDITSRIEDRVKVVKEASFSLRSWRNKKIAHLDHSWATGSFELPDLSAQNFRIALDELAAILNDVQEGLDGSGFAFDGFPRSGDGDALIRALESSDQRRAD